MLKTFDRLLTIGWLLVLTAFMNVVSVSAQSLCSVPTFSDAHNFSVGTSPSAIVAADFNGDGKSDLAVANFNSNNISILLGSGNGNFTGPANLSTGQNPSSIVAADFNNDGKQDLAVTNQGSNSVSIFLDTGGGNFTASTDFVVGSVPLSVAVGDFNADGKRDLAVSNSGTNSISILLGTGTGSFTVLTSAQAGNGLGFITVGDFNNDNKDDLAVTVAINNCCTPDSILILLGTGTGTFNAKKPFIAGGISSIAVGDFNGDGNSDLAMTEPATDSLFTIHGQGTGDFSGLSVSHQLKKSPQFVKVGDFNGDKKSDLVVAVKGNANFNVSFAFGQGNGLFNDAINFSAGSSPDAVAIGDFNGDGLTDVAVTNYSSNDVSILLNTCGTRPSGIYSISGVVNGGNVFTEVQLSGTKTGISGLNTDTGHYSFPNLPAGGTYTITPVYVNSIFQYTFSPTSKTFTDLSANQTFDFTQTLVTNSISGRVTTASGAGIAGVDVVLNMTFGGATKTDSNGNYSFPNLASGQSYRVSPVSQNYTFTPTAADITSLSGNVTTNFVGNPLYNITGRITDRAGAGIAGVLVIVNGPMSRSATTDSNGNYLINSLPAGGNYTMSLSKVDYGFNPPGLTINNLSGDQAANFTGFKVYSIGGFISDENGNAVSGVTMSLAGAQTATIVTTTSGRYSFNNLPEGGDYTVTPSKSNYTFNPTSQTFSNLSSQQTASFIASPMLAQFGSAGLQVGEGAGNIAVVVSRTGNVLGAASVDYATSDTAGLAACNQVTGIASSRCDYANTVGTLRFAVGESSKTIFIPVVDDGYVEGAETFTIKLSNPSGLGLGTNSIATIAITDNDGATSNPIVGVPFFVRQQYIDFLGREPDTGGFAAWQNILNNCIAGDTSCDRIAVSSGFYRSPEFQDRGYFIFRFYSAAFGRNPFYAEFMPDLAKVSGFLSDAQLEANKVAFINEFMARPEYVNRYGSIASNQAYVDALLQTAGLQNHPLRQPWIDVLNNGTATRAEVLRAFTESLEVYNKFYNQAFVVMQYFGYLRRDPDASYLDWIRIMNQNGGDFRGMISGFMNSNEYVLRFGP